MVAKKLKRRLPPTVTDKEYLAGSEIEDIELFFADLKKRNTDYPERTIEFIGKTYGREADAIFSIARKNSKLAAPLNEDGEMLAQVVYAVREEMAKTLGDIVFRRTGLGTLGYPGDTALRKIAGVAARELKWSEARMKKEIAAVKEMLTLPK
jgi:glycerol-3-phosphate dehydrogenase